jgi:hypothetical protein
VIFIASSGLHQFITLAQSQEGCDVILNEAEKKYQAGYFDESIGLIKDCLESPTIADIEKSRAYSLLLLIYISTDLKEEQICEVIKDFNDFNFELYKEYESPYLKKIIQNCQRKMLQSILTQIVLQAAWGADSNHVGRKILTTNNFVVPKSFVVDTTEKITILDVVNARLVVWKDGSQINEISLPSGRFDDVDLSPNGDFILLDRTDREAIVYIDINGTLLKEAALEGMFLPYTDRVTAMFSRSDGVWVEIDDMQSVKITNKIGEVDSLRGRISGQFSCNGDLNLRATIHGDITAVVSTRKYPDTGEGWSAPVYFSDLLLHLFMLDTDHNNNVYLGAKYSITDPKYEIVKLDSTGKELNRISLTASIGQGEIFRSCRVLQNGTLYYMRFNQDGIIITKHEL